jgi:hypothetical protein
MKHLMLAAAIGLLTAQAQACALTQSLAERYGISFSGFGKAIRETSAPDTAHGGPFVRVRIPDDNHVADGFRHTVVLDRSTKRAWILRTGGFVGVYQWYGPVDAVDASLVNCPLEPADRISQDAPQPAPRHG